MSHLMWFIFAGILAIGELFTMGFLLMWFAVGALLTGLILLAFPSMNFAIQIALFALSSGLLFLITKNKLRNKIEKNSTPPVYSILGKTAIVTKEINSIKGTGQITINGDIWSAKTKDSEDIISENSKVEVLEVDGVKAVVKVVESAVNIQQ